MDAKAVTERTREHCKKAQETCKRILARIEEMKGEDKPDVKAD